MSAPGVLGSRFNDLKDKLADLDAANMLDVKAKARAATLALLLLQEAMVRELMRVAHRADLSAENIERLLSEKS